MSDMHFAHALRSTRMRFVTTRIGDQHNHRDQSDRSTAELKLLQLSRSKTAVTLFDPLNEKHKKKRGKTMSEGCTHDCSTCGESCSERKAEDMKLRQNDYSNIKKVIAVVSGKGDCLAVLLVLQALIIFLWTGINPALCNFLCRDGIGILAL